MPSSRVLAFPTRPPSPATDLLLPTLPPALTDAAVLAIAAAVVFTQLAWLHGVYKVQPPVRSWDNLGIFAVYWALNLGKAALLCYAIMLPFKVVSGVLQAMAACIEPSRVLGRALAPWVVGV